MRPSESASAPNKAKQFALLFETGELPGVLDSANDARFHRMLADIRRAPNLYLQAGALETCLRQVWALVAYEDEELFFDNVQAVEREAKKWRCKR